MFEVDLIIPVHNEEGSIGKVIDEFYQVLTLNNNRALRFIICEDGSKDNTVEVVRKKQAEIPILLLTQKMRQGYSQAVIEGFKKSEASLVSFVDGDGQCDQADLLQLLENIKDFDMVLGY